MSDLTSVVQTCRTFHLRYFLCFLLLLIFMGGCSDETAVISAPPDTTEEPADTTESSTEEEPPPAEEKPPLFSSYVALGDNMTAGYQSDGINAELQGQSYAALVAQAIGSEYTAPLIEMPGCPPPITDSYTRERPDETSCELIASTPTIFHNVAVPDAYLVDLFPPSNDRPPLPENPLNTLMLGGRTQLEAAAEAQPTFVSLWFGTHTFLDQYMEMRRTRTFDTYHYFSFGYASLIDSLQALGVQGGVVITAPFLHLPYWSTSKAYVKAKEEGLLPATYEVSENCSQYFALVGYDYGIGELWTRAQAGESVKLDCEHPDPKTKLLLDEIEWRYEGDRLEAHNAVLADAAWDRGWIVVNMYNLLSELEDAEGIPTFPNLPGSDEPTFGPYFSKDGLHLSQKGHEFLANKVIEAINKKYGTSFSVLNTEAH